MKQKLKPTSLSRKIRRQQNLLDKYKHRDAKLKWSTGLIGLLAFVLLLLFGFATDWTAGLRKSPPSNIGSAPNKSTTNTTTPLSAASSNTVGNASDTSVIHKSSTTTSNTTSTTNSTTSGNTSSTSNTADNGSSSTTNGSSNNLLDLYTNSSAGNSISSVTKQANALGITGNCRTDTLIQVCDFTQNGNTVTIYDVPGTGMVTGVTKNF